MITLHLIFLCQDRSSLQIDHDVQKEVSACNHYFGLNFDRQQVFHMKEKLGLHVKKVYFICHRTNHGNS